MVPHLCFSSIFDLHLGKCKSIGHQLNKRMIKEDRVAKLLYLFQEDVDKMSQIRHVWKIKGNFNLRIIPTQASF